ncbi:hypothetical protein BGZ83_011067 [Gryganskiella cystojenkinii]|nr:hypothetical protein BGZ83_011067 [Gryganskiella cystojenkinii]
MTLTPSSKSTWLNQLPEHSIFQLDEQEYLEWARLNNKTLDSKGSTGNAINSFGAKSTNSSSNTTVATTNATLFATANKMDRDSFGLDELKDDYMEASQGLSCMAVHGQDLFLAVGRQVRHASLSELKKGVENISKTAAEEYIEKKQHKVLKIQHVDFDIRRLVLNPEGKLMAIVGDEKIVIAALPKALKQDPRAVNCKSFVLGEFYHINKGPSKIVKVLWHPLSKGCTDVLVMTHDGMLRMYNVASDIDEPDQVFNFFGEDGHRSSTYGLDVDDLASFCFGSKFSEWGQLTVYGLTQSGDIYMMCPVMPQNCLLGVSDLDEIRSKLIKETATLAASTGERSLTAIKKEWLECLLESVQPHPFSDEVVMVQRPVLKNASTARQGPFLYQPAPHELDDDDNRAFDILSLDTEAVDVIVVAHSSGRVDICLAVDRPTAQWTLPKPVGPKGYGGNLDDQINAEELPTVSVYESIDLGLLAIFGTSSPSTAGAYGLQEQRLGIPNRPVLVQDTMYGDTFYIYHEAGAHCVSIRPWLEKLTAVFEAAAKGQIANMDSEINRFYESSIESSLCYVVSTRPTRTSPAAPVVGYSVIVDPYLEYSLLMLTSSLQLIGIQLSPRPHDDINKITSQTSTHSLSTAAAQKTYTSSLSKPTFEEQGGLMSPNGLPLRPKVVLPPGAGKASIVVSEENLRFLSTMVQGIRESVREVYSAGDLAQQRVEEQLIEYKRQQDLVRKTHEYTQTTLVRRTQEQANRLDAQNTRQLSLMARADNLLQKLMESKEPELSPAEKAWVSEVAKGEKAVKAYNERRHKVQTQYEILNRRMKEMLQGADLDESSSTTDAEKRGFGQPAKETGMGDSILSSSGTAGDSTLTTPRRVSSTYSSQPKRPTMRFGTTQLKSVESALSIESQLLDSTVKQLQELNARMEALQVAPRDKATATEEL